MAGYGLGFGSLNRSRKFAALGQNVPVAALRPSAAWDGTPGSGFAGSPPVDPVRQTAKPVCRLLTPPNQFFTDELVIGVFAGANHNGSLLDNFGLDRVIAHCEGESLEIAAPSFLLFEDVNGQTRRYLGWWLVLQHPGRNGHLQVYFEAVPKDATMQHRVIGPYQFSPQASLHDFEIEVAPSQAVLPGARYQSIAAAVAYCVQQAAQNPRITITESLTDGMWFWSQNAYNPEGYFTIEATEAVTFKANDPYPAAQYYLRPRVDGLWFKGSNIRFDFYQSGSMYHENPENRDHVFEGVEFTDSGGRYYLPLKGPKPMIYIARDRPYYLECRISNIQEPCNYARLVRGCTIHDGNRDAATYALCVIGNTIYNWTSKEYREQIDALVVHYTGPGSSASLELSGANQASNRVMTARVDGAVAGSFTIESSVTAHAADTHYTVQNVADWLGGLPGWSASVLDDTRRAVSLSLRGNNPLGAAFPATDARSSPLTLVTAIDDHADLWALAHPNSSDNVIFYGNTCYNNLVQSLYVGPPGGLRDCLIANNTFDLDENDPEYGGSISQLTREISHLVVAHNSWSNQVFRLRGNVSFSFDGDAYCLIANNVAPAIGWDAAADPDVTITNNHLFAGAPVPAGSSGTTVGGTRATLFADPSTGNFAPQGALLTNLKPPVLRYDIAGIARGIPAVPGASAGGGEVAPAITSSNPSGTYAEGAPVGGRVTASKPVAWSVTGPDAGFVQLDPGLGDWVLEPTDFETKTGYAFTFVATDLAGDTAEQIVAIAISDLDEIAPVLSSAQASGDGSSAADLAIVTSEGNGTLHWAVSTDPMPPGAAELIAGAGFVASGSRPVVAAGTQAVSVSGLAAGTSFFAHFLHRDGAGNASAVVSSAAFATDQASSSAPAIASFASVLNTSDFGDTYAAAPFAFSGTAGNALLVIVAAAQQGTQALADLAATVDGVAMARLSGAAHTDGASRPIIGVFLASGLAAGNRMIEAKLAGNGRSCTILAMEVAGIDLAAPLANLAVVQGSALGYSHSYTPDSAGNLIVSVLATRQGDRGPFTPDPGVAVLQDASSGSTATNDHSVFAGYLVPSGTAATDVGATPSLEAVALFVVTELRAG